MCWSTVWQSGGEGRWGDLPSRWLSAWQWRMLSPVHCLLCTGNNQHPQVPAGWWAEPRGFGSWPAWMTWRAGRPWASTVLEKAHLCCCTRTWQCCPGTGTLSRGAVQSLEGLFQAGHKSKQLSINLLSFSMLAAANTGTIQQDMFAADESPHK